MGRKNLSKRNSKRRGNKYRNSKRMNSKRMNSKRGYYKRRTNNYRNTKKRTNKFKNSNRKLKKFICGGSEEIIIDCSFIEDERYDMDNDGNYYQVILGYYLIFKYDDTELFLRIPVSAMIIRKSNTDLITSVRNQIVSYFDSFKDNNEIVKSLRNYEITYKYYFSMEAGNKVELKADNTIDEDIDASNINALIIKLNYEETGAGRPAADVNPVPVYTRGPGDIDSRVQ